MWEPFGALSTNATASWRSSPNGRGTLTILSSCLITLVLCVYTCLHVDIPEHGKTHWAKVLKRKLLWLLPGIFVPETVSIIAFRQWHSAKSLDLYMKVALDPLMAETSQSSSIDKSSESHVPSNTRRVHPWTRVHSHYALMGGFAFDTTKSAVPFLPEGRSHLTLTSAALRRLASYEPDIIPDVSVEYIRERSKADGFAKGIACIQAIWFLIQVSGRLAARYPISLLELNTFLHAFCCLGIYMAWWSKPLDIEQPTLIDASQDPARKICAWMVMQSAIGNRPVCYAASGSRSTRGYKFQHLLYEADLLQGTHPDKSFENGRNIIRLLRDHNRAEGRDEDIDLDLSKPPSISDDKKDGHIQLYAGQRILGFRLVIGVLEQPSYDAYTKLSVANMECLRLALAFCQDPNLQPDWQFGPWEAFIGANVRNLLVACESARFYSSQKRATDQDWIHYAKENEANSANWATRLFRKLSYSNDAFYLWMTMFSSLYGGIHLIAWNGPFPTPIELKLWRVATLYLACTFPSELVSSCLFKLQLPFLFRNSKRVQKWQHEGGMPKPVVASFVAAYKLCKALFWSIEILYIVFYGVARVYIVVECFKGLAYLPDQVYDEPDWIKFIAHIGAG